MVLMWLPTGAWAQIEIFPKGGLELKTDEGKIRLGRMEIHPGLDLETRYDSNIFQAADTTFANGTSESPTDDLIFTITPSIGVDLERGKGEVFGFTMKYLAIIERFLDLTEENTVDHDISGAINFGGPGGRSDFNAGARYFKTRSLSDRDLESNLGSRQDLEEFSFFGDMVYTLSQTFKVKLQGDYLREDFSGSPALANEDVDTINLGGSIFWQLTKPTAVGFRYNHRIRDYLIPQNVNFDSDSDAGYFLVKWEPTKLLRGEVALGYQNTRFDNISGQDLDGFVFDVDMDYRPVQRTVIRVSGTRQILDSSFQLIQGYIYTAGTGSLEQRLGKKFSAQVVGTYENLDYQKAVVDSVDGGGLKVREDHTLRGQFALIYDIQRWLKASAEYVYEQNFSNFDDQDFIRHVGLFRLSANY